jgi:quercetin dioxygenase-like cupin family protein
MTDKPTRLQGAVQKGWGYELIFATNDKYCGKILFFEKAGSKFSMHFHKEKDETWFVNSGKFKLRYINPNNATLMEQELKEGDVWNNPPCLPHQLEALTDGASITEVSTPDSVEDNYRIIPGDSQSNKEEETPKDE